MAVTAWLAAVAWVGPPRGDFANYWTAAALWREGADLARLYDYRWFTEQASRLGFGDQLVGFAVLTPTSALLAAPLLPLGPEAGARAWQVGQALFGVAIAWALARTTRRPLWVGFLPMLVLWPAFRSHLAQGQAHLPAVAAVALGGMVLRRPLAAGVAWGLAVALKVHAWPLLLTSFRVAGAGFGALAAVSAVSVAALGWGVHRVWTGEIAPASARGWFTDPFHLGYQDLVHGLRHLLVAHPGLNPRPWMDAPALAEALVAGIPVAAIFLTVSARPAAADVTRHLAAASMVAMAFGPILASYHLVLLAPALVWGADTLVRRARPGRAGLVIACAAFTAWVPLDLPMPLGVARFWGAAAMWALLLPRWRPSMALAGVYFAGTAVFQAWRADPDGAVAVDDPSFPLVAAGLTPDLRFSGLSADRGGRPGRGWMGYRLVDGRAEIVEASPDAHVFYDHVEGEARAIDGDIWLGDRQLTRSRAWDSDPVVAGDRVYFLSDRGAGVRALRLWYVTP